MLRSLAAVPAIAIFCLPSTFSLIHGSIARGLGGIYADRRRLGVHGSSMIVAFAYAGLTQSDGFALSIRFDAREIIWVVSGLRLRRTSLLPPAQMFASPTESGCIIKC
jgi:hypothetical protein